EICRLHINVHRTGRTSRSSRRVGRAASKLRRTPEALERDEAHAERRVGVARSEEYVWQQRFALCIPADVSELEACIGGIDRDLERTEHRRIHQHEPDR